MKRLSVFILALLIGGAAVQAQTLTVAAAANLSAVEAPLKAAFAQKYPGMSLQFTFGASGNLVTQILNGAPFSAFLSADMGFAQKVYDAGLAAGPVKTYALGKLIFLSTKPLVAGEGLKVLAKSDVAQFAIANPETAPYGKAAVETLTKAGLYDQVKGKIIQGQNITQALQFTLTAAGCGFVNKSALLSKDVAPYSEEGKYWFEVDPSDYSPIAQGMVMLKSGADAPAAKAFAAFLFSPEAQAVFAQYGYGKP